VVCSIISPGAFRLASYRNIRILIAEVFLIKQGKANLLLQYYNVKLKVLESAEN